MDDLAIQDALKSAKYNEAVVLTVATNSNGNGTRVRRGGEEIVLVPQLDRTNGGVVWNNVSVGAPPISPTSPSLGSDHDIGISQHIRTKKWVIPMLNDDRRNKLYAASIRKGCKVAVDLMLSKSGDKHDDNNSNCAAGGEKNTLRILDIGSGTGLLAMMAAKTSLELLKDRDEEDTTVVVKSVEMASAMSRLAYKTVSRNCLEHTIDIIEGHSCDKTFSPFIVDPSSSSSSTSTSASTSTSTSTKVKAKANMCTSELLESSLLGEGIIPAMRDAWDRHLCEEGAVVIPQRARVYAQVVESSWLTNYRGPSTKTGSTSNSRSRMNLSLSGDPKGVLLGGEVRVPLHAEALFHYGDGTDDDGDDSSNFNLGRGPSDSDDIDQARQLSEPALVLEFDFTSRQAIPPKVGRSVKNELVASDNGDANAVIFWWELDLFDETYYTTEVGQEYWQDHWLACAFICCPDEEGRYKKLVKDETFTLISGHDDYSISFQIETKEAQQQDDVCHDSKKRKTLADGVPQHISFERALQLNDKERMSHLFSAIETALELKGHNSAEILDVSDFSLCALIAATEFGAKNVTSIESSSGNIPMLSATVAQIGNRLPKENCKFQIINAHLESLCLEHLQGSGVDIVMSEPYYEIMQGWNLPCALNYYYTLKSLKGRGLVKPDAISIPSFASVKCCAIEFHKSVIHAHCGLKTEDGRICNFKHDDVVSYGKEFHTYDMVFPLWQYKWKRLSDDITLSKINYEGDVTIMSIAQEEEKWSDIKFSKVGHCQAIAMWIDYGLKIQDKTSGETETGFKTISTGNKFNQQAVRMLSLPVTIDEDNIDSLRLSVKLSLTECKGNEDYCFEIKAVMT